MLRKLTAVGIGGMSPKVIRNSIVREVLSPKSMVHCPPAFERQEK